MKTLAECPRVQGKMSACRLRREDSTTATSGVKTGWEHTPLTILVPIRVTYPFTLSERSDDSTSVEPGSTGANSFTHSSNPSFRAAKEDCNELRYHCSSFSYTELRVSCVFPMRKGDQITRVSCSAMRRAWSETGG